MIVVEDAGDDAVAGQQDELPSAGAVPAGTGQAVDDTGPVQPAVRRGAGGERRATGD